MFFSICLQIGTQLSQLELSVGIGQLNSSFPGSLSGWVRQLWTDVTARPCQRRLMSCISPNWWLQTPAKQEPYSFTVEFMEGCGAALCTTRYTIISIQTDYTNWSLFLCHLATGWRGVDA